MVVICVTKHYLIDFPVILLQILLPQTLEISIS
jgi:hypothetical protein